MAKHRKTPTKLTQTRSLLIRLGLYSYKVIAKAMFMFPFNLP